MKIKKFNENVEDDYLESPEYFIETFYNGQFGQLKEMLILFKDGVVGCDLKCLIDYIEENMKEQHANKLKNWMLLELGKL